MLLKTLPSSVHQTLAVTRGAHEVNKTLVLAFYRHSRSIPSEQEPSMGTGPVCCSSCTTFFSEAATQHCTASTVIHS